MRETEREWDLLGIGDAAVDLYIRVKSLPGRDEKVMGQYLGEYAGGMISNVCCATSRFGARTAMAAVVGDDRYGRLAVEGLREYGVDTSQIRVQAGGRTFFCVSFLDDTGEKALMGVRSDLLVPKKSDLDPEALGRATAVHVIANDAELASWVAREAQARGTQVSVDLEAVSTTGGLEAVRAVLQDVDIAFMNESGLREGLGVAPEEGARLILDSGPTVAVVTAGGSGAFVATGEEVTHIPAFKVPVADTTGAGDCFNGVFLTGYLQGWDLHKCGLHASAAAALSVTRIGARAALPDQREVEAFLSTQPATAVPEDPALMGD